MQQVLEQQVRLNAAKLIDRNLEETSLLALAIGPKYLPACERFTGASSDQSSVEKDSRSSAESLILSRLEEILKKFEPGVRILAQHSGGRGKGNSPTKRDAILFAAIVRNVEQFL